MGTELHHGVGQLNESLNNQKSNALKTSHYWSQPKKIAAQDRTITIIKQYQGIMNRSQEQLNRETMRQTMLRQEELFREQVRELHRLYHVQKTLMSELHKNKQKALLYTTQSRIINPNPDPHNRTFRPPPMPTPFITIHHPYNQHQSFDVQCDGSSEEPSCSSQRGFDIVSSRANYEEPEPEPVRSSPWRGDHSEVDNELELTLSIGQQKNSKEKKPITEEEGESSHPNNSSSDQSNSHKPHWLLQALSLNRT